MSEYHREAFYKLEEEYRAIKAQRNELLWAAKDVYRATRWLKDEEHERAYRRLEAAIARAEQRA